VPGVDVVRAADDRGVGLAVEHLAALGHRHIAFVDGPRGPIATLRRQGYRAALGRLGLAGEAAVVPGGGTEEDGARAAGALLARWAGTPGEPGGSGESGESGEPHARATAVVAFNDRCALGVLDAVRRSGAAVPADLSVVGYDDSPVARLGTVDLTTVSQAPRAMAWAAVAAAVERLEGGRTEPVDVVLEPHLVVRGTSAAPPAAR
jgi:DNA-binding LacI/PurR family transcriptional regulator